jgi:hypothetical protein
MTNSSMKSSSLQSETETAVPLHAAAGPRGKRRISCPVDRLAELPTAPETEAFDSGASHKPAPDSSERHVFKAMSAAAIDARQRRHADRQTRRPVERALGHVEPVPRCCAILSTAKDAAGALLDHLMDVNNMPEPWMPRIEDFEFPDPMSVISPPCTTSVGRTRPWVTRLRLRPRRQR